MRLLPARALFLGLAAFRLLDCVAAETEQTAIPGESIYLRGALPDGANVTAARDGGATVTGTTAACVNCHRRSGLGSFEGTTLIPPIIGRYLFRPRAVNIADPTLPHVPGFTPNREAYDNATLAAAIRDGVAPGGRTLSYLMPRYAFDDAAMSALVSYLRQLNAQPAPGVGDSTLQFATIVTPQAPPADRDAMLAVMEHFFAVQNQVLAAEVRPMVARREIMYRVTRRWNLHIWQLQGPPATWRAQLDQFFKSEPVFAVVSGIGGETWRPIHDFCEDRHLPCLLPNVDLPIVAEHDFYSVYWSRGVLLEADLIARGIASRTPGDVGSIVQLYRPGDIGAVAAHELAERVAGRNGKMTDRPLPKGKIGAGELTALRPGDSLVLWLRESDIADLPRQLPAGVHVYASGLMGGLERAAFAPAWRANLTLAYPYDLPEARQVRMNFPLGWFRVQRLPIVNERIQANTLLACQVLAETLGHMLDSFVPDYLLEEMEMLVSRRAVNGYFPRLGLGPGQRFASKGGYLVRFAAKTGTELKSESEWLVP